MKVDVSIIIVHYQSLNWLLQCLQSIYAYHTKVSFEIILVDNDVKKTIKKQLLSKYPNIKYLKSPGNIGYGAGNNLGAKKANGKYLFFLNPDTEVRTNTIDILSEYLDINPETAVVAPQITDQKGKIYQDQCTNKLTPISGIFSHTIIHKLFPKNPIAKKFWYKDWNRKSKMSVEAIQGSAFLIRTSLFNKLKGFDEKYFLYFEETDICRRILQTNSKIIFLPDSQVVHHQEKSTKDKEIAKEYFIKSRNYFFIKHYGRFIGNITNLIFFLLDKWKLAIATITIISVCVLS